MLNDKSFREISVNDVEYAIDKRLATLGGGKVSSGILPSSCPACTRHNDNGDDSDSDEDYAEPSNRPNGGCQSYEDCESDGDEEECDECEEDD